jgi:hypothetical protein
MKVRCIKFTPFEGCGNAYLTEGKVYEVREADKYAFTMIDDEGDELYIVWKDSVHGVFEKVED